MGTTARGASKRSRADRLVRETLRRMRAPVVASRVPANIQTRAATASRRKLMDDQVVAFKHAYEQAGRPTGRLRTAFVTQQQAILACEGTIVSWHTIDQILRGHAWQHVP